MSSFTRDTQYILLSSGLFGNVDAYEFRRHSHKEYPKAIIEKQSATNFGSIPDYKIIRWFFRPDEFKKPYQTHDLTCGEYDDPIEVILDEFGNKRTLSWDESAAWLREGIRIYQKDLDTIDIMPYDPWLTRVYIRYVLNGFCIKAHRTRNTIHRQCIYLAVRLNGILKGK